ncbi:MAG: threonine ammonia-lyase [Acidimicrobiia bacterium]|nr:threonine ammonia-lyase [Acidimicrobiia bacterium]
MDTDLITIDAIREAAVRAAPVALETPLLPGHTFARMTGSDIWLKAENLQRTGSFKVRGAMNALSLLDDAQREAGVVAASAGNHAQGVALAASTLGIDATVFMPEAAPLPKVTATRSYGAEVVLGGAGLGDAVDAAMRYREESGAHFVHPYDDRDILTGQAGLGLELIDQMPEPGAVVIPVGGGGLCAGSAAAIKRLHPDTVVIGVEAAAAATYVASRAAGEPTPVEPRFTLADGIAVSRPSELVFAHLEAFVDDIVTVDDDEMTSAVALLLERAKFLVEPSGAAGLAALFAGLVPDVEGPTVVVLSGGNVDLLLIDRVIRKGLHAAGRFGSFRVLVPDVPGQLARIASAVAEIGANVVQVEHRREGSGLPFGTTQISFAVETRDEQQLDEIVAAMKEIDVSGAT